MRDSKQAGEVELMFVMENEECDHTRSYRRTSPGGCSIGQHDRRSA